MSEFIEINLLPIEDRKIKKDYSFILDTRVVVPILALIGIVLLSMSFQRAFNSDLTGIKGEITRVDRLIGDNKKTLADLKKQEILLEEKNAKNRSLQSISFNKQLWVRVLEGLSKTLPPNSWVKEVYQDRANRDQLVLTGVTHLFSEVALYMIELEKDEYFLSVSLEKIEVEKLTESFIFTLKIKLNMNKGVQNPAGGDSLKAS